jgi:hypothetical protein
MQKIILFFFFIFLTNLLHAQQLSVSSNYTTLQGRSHHEVAPSVVLKNTGNSTITVRWEQVRANVPDGWEVVVCDKRCYSTLVTKKSFTLAPGETLSDFRVSFRPNGVNGIGTVELKIYDAADPSNSQTVMFSASAQSSSLFNNGASAANLDKPSVYPNPAIEHIMLRDAQSTVKFIEIYNVVGRKIKTFSVRHDGDKYDVSDLQMGMYMVRMLDQNRNIIRTERISKYNP